MRRYKAKGYISDFEEVDRLADIIGLFEWSFKGVVKTPWSDTASINVAQMLGSVEDCFIFISDSDILNDLECKYKVYHDLTGRFSSNVEAYRWAYDNLWSGLNHELAALKHASTLATRDYAIANRLFIFLISGEKDGQLPGASQHEETMFARMLFEQLPPNSPIMGYPYAGEGIGPGEGGGVSLLTEYAKFVACDSPNLTVHSGIRTPALKQSSLERSICPKLENDKVYISFIISDGDNMNVWDYTHFDQQVRDPNRGNIPIGWTMGPALVDLKPLIAKHYYETATEMDYFLAAVSGIGYIYPRVYADRLKNPEDVFNEYISITAHFMEKMGMTSVNVHHLYELGIITMKGDLTLEIPVWDMYAVPSLPGMGAVLILLLISLAFVTPVLKRSGLTQAELVTVYVVCVL